MLITVFGLIVALRRATAGYYIPHRLRSMVKPIPIRHSHYDRSAPRGCFEGPDVPREEPLRPLRLCEKPGCVRQVSRKGAKVAKVLLEVHPSISNYITFTCSISSHCPKLTRVSGCASLRRCGRRRDVRALAPALQSLMGSRYSIRRSWWTFSPRRRGWLAS
jgi:hypothetical protein